MHREHRSPAVSQQSATELVYISHSADLAELCHLRHELASWAYRLGMSVEQTEPMILATYEAMANAATHAYLGEAGTLDLRAHYVPDEHQLVITVTDRGRWRTPVEGPGRLGGLGLPLIRSLAEHADIEPSANGTTVRMSWTFPTVRYEY